MERYLLNLNLQGQIVCLLLFMTFLGGKKNNEHRAHLNVLHRLRPQPLLEANILFPMLSFIQAWGENLIT